MQRRSDEKELEHGITAGDDGLAEQYFIKQGKCAGECGREHGQRHGQRWGHCRIENYALDLGSRSGTTGWASFAFGGVFRRYWKSAQSLETGVGDIEAQRRCVS